MEATVAIVQPKFVFGSWQAVLEFYHVTYVDGGYGGVGRWITDCRAVVQTVPRTSLAQVSWYLDREVCRIRDLKIIRGLLTIFHIQQQFRSIEQIVVFQLSQGQRRDGTCNFSRQACLSCT